MFRLRFAVVLVLLLLAVSVYMGALGMFSAHVTSAAPALQATAVPTPAASSTASAAAPIGQGTQQVLMIVGFVVLSAVLIAGGIYLRRRWIATRY